MDEEILGLKIAEKVKRVEDYFERRLKDLREDVRGSIIAERDALRESISQIKRIEPNVILADIQNIKDALTDIRDKINNVEIWKAEKLEGDVRKYNITHAPEDMKDMYKKSGVTLKELSDKFFISKCVISRLINFTEGDAVLRHKVYLYMIQEAHKKIKDMENELLSDGAATELANV